MIEKFEIELSKAKEILDSLRSKKTKNHKDYEAIIDLNYFISFYKSSNNITEQWGIILEKIRSGYYNEYKKVVQNKNEDEIKLKLGNDNMQYCFF